MKNMTKCILKLVSAALVLAAAIWACVTYWDKISAFFRSLGQRLGDLFSRHGEYADYDEEWGISL